MIIPEGQIFRADFSRSFGPARCLMAGPSSVLWKWHRRLGHLSFDLVSHFSGLDLVRELPRLKFEKDLVCAPCRHGKMVATPHPPLTDVMTERPTELLHMDLVGPARVRSVGRKWYVLVVVDDYSRYAWMFFLEDKSETFGFVRDLIVRLKNERHGNVIRAIRSDNGSEFKNYRLDAFCRDLGLEHQYSTPYVPPSKMELWKGKIGLFVRWLGRCSMSTGLLEGIELRRSIWLVMSPTEFYCELSRGIPVMSLCMVGHPR
jgi:transposase InsO family protein